LAVKIRMKKMGAKKKPFFRVVAADARSPRDGRFIELLGFYNPMTDPPDLKFDDDKVFKWLDAGAEPTESAGQLLKRAGLLERWQLLKRGVKISELDSKIAERREKQPKPISKEDREAAKEKKAADKEKADAAEADAAKEAEAPEVEVAEVKETAKTGEPKEEIKAETEEPSETSEAERVEQKPAEQQEEKKKEERAEGNGAEKKE
jgi:small subunit ribosomal protein S16